jgi:nucleoside-diphosphate-sugar epimerase
MAFLVTGGCGYIGTRLTQALLEHTGQEVTVLDTAWFGNYLAPHPRLTVRIGDIRQLDRVDLSSFDTIFHLAGIANDSSAELNPYASWEVNVLATMRLVDRAARLGVRQFERDTTG